MNTTATLQTPSLKPEQSATNKQSRIMSIDILRGFIMLTMLFVNDVAATPKLWWWSKHFYPYNESGMTYVDVVFPAFLFIVGMSVPFALSKQLQTKPLYKVLLHIFTRTASLLLLGFFTVNGADYEKMGWYNGAWQILVYTSCIALYIQFPSPQSNQSSNRKLDFRKYTNIIIKSLAVISLSIAWYFFQNKNGEAMRPHWWGILGLIGWVYLLTSLTYIIFRNNLFALAFAMGIFIAMYLSHRPIQPATWKLPDDPAFHTLPHLNFIYRIKYIPMSITMLTAISLAGTLLASAIKFGSPNSNGSFTNTNAAKLKFALIFAAALAFAGYLLHYPHGVLKNGATPAWGLYCSAITTIIWIIFFIIFDMLKHKKLGTALAYTGQNALLAYLLHPLLIWIQIAINTATSLNENIPEASRFWITPMAFGQQQISIWGNTITFPQPYTGITRSALTAIIILSFTAYIARKKCLLKL
ncbi:DUF5009 domain-containing protein [Planctomycetota bacterium]|nr:DUF5009 domain-containing protein [Planctomycetota bacterium]